MKKALLILTIAVLLTLLTVAIVSAQGAPPPMLPGGPDQVPIDGGLALLAAAGGGYAIKKLRDRKN